MMFFPNWFGIWFQGSLWCNKWGWIGGFGGQCPSRSQSLDYFTSNQGHAPKEFLFNEYNVWQTKNGKLFFDGEEENLTFLLFIEKTSICCCLKSRFWHKATASDLKLWIWSQRQYLLIIFKVSSLAVNCDLTYFIIRSSCSPSAFDISHPPLYKANGPGGSSRIGRFLKWAEDTFALNFSR